MSNSLLTLGGITREAVRLWKNSNAFVQSIDHQYDDSYARQGAKIGSQLRIRLPNDFTVRTGAPIALNTVNELQTTLTMGTQKGVDIPFTSTDRTLSLDDYSERILMPMINNLAGAVASDIMSGASAISNITANTTTPVADDFLTAGAILDEMSAPRGGRKAVLSPRTQARTVSGLAGLFNPTGRISKQFDTGEMMGPALGIEDWMSDQTVSNHTNGTAAGITVSGASQTGTSILMKATTGGTMAIGDKFTIAGVYAVNRITKQATGSLQQFTVTALATLNSSTAVAVSIYPAITPPSGVDPVQYQTVTASPADGATVTVAGGSFSGGFRQNFVMRPEAVTMVSADLWMPESGKGVIEAARESFDGISMRMITAYDPNTDQTFTRLDVLYGYLWVRPEWAVVVPDIL